MTQPGSSVTMDEIAEQIAAGAAAGADPSTMKLEGDMIPEPFRGKTVADILAQQKLMADAVEQSNRKVRELESANVNRPASVQQFEAPVAQPDPRLSKEQLAELFEKDPIGAVAYMQDIAIKDAANQFERRFAPLTAGSAQAAENSAKAKFADEFALFGGEIKNVIDAMPDKSILANPAAWDNIISFVRGKPENFDKLMAIRTSKAAEAAALAARTAESHAAGASMTSSVRPGAPSVAVSSEGNYGLNADEMHAADVMGTSYKDYAHWKKIGG